MAPLVFAGLWVISASLVNLPGVIREQSTGELCFQTKMRLNLYIFKKINWCWSADTQNNEDLLKPFCMSALQSALVSKWCSWHLVTSCTQVLHVRRSKVLLEVNWGYISWKKIGKWEHWFVFIHVDIVCSLWFVAHLWVWLLFHDECSWNMAQEPCWRQLEWLLTIFIWFLMCPFPLVTKPVIPFACVFAVALCIFCELENWVNVGFLIQNSNRLRWWNVLCPVTICL